MRRTRPRPGSKPPAHRVGEVRRKTRETSIEVRIDLDGGGRSRIATGLPFLDHMLDQVARHGRFDIDLAARGDLDVDAHHTVEDTGIALGAAVAEAVAAGPAVRRFGDAHCPLDEALALAVIDLSGRPFVAFDAAFRRREIGGFPLEVVLEFFRGFAIHARAAVHVRLLAGKNDHHKVEAIFKAFARALHEATAIDPRVEGVPSTKGVL